MAKHFEIMAPGGDFSSLAAALRSGADSVYVGVGDLNMRSHATMNFEQNELAEVVRLCRAAGKPEAENMTCIFTDVNAEAYYYDALLWAVENGILYGDEHGNLMLRQPCTREQMIVFLHRVYKLVTEGTA